MTGCIRFHQTSDFQELGHPAERQRTNVDSCKRMTESIYTDNPLHSSVKNVRAFGKQLSLINLLWKMRISVFTHMETETQGYLVPCLQLYSVPVQQQQYFYLEPFFLN